MDSFFLSYSPLWEVCLVELGVQQFDQAGWPLSSSDLPVSSPSPRPDPRLQTFSTALGSYDMLGIRTRVFMPVWQAFNRSSELLSKGYFFKKQIVVLKTVWVYMCQVKQKVSDPLELELQKIISLPMWVLETNLRS